MKKLLVVGITILFIGLIVPTSGYTALFDDTTPPVTICTLDPPEPDGENGWYVSDVNVTLNATDDMSGVKEIRYTVNGVSGTIQGDFGIFTLPEDGDDILVEYWAIDNAGNVELKHSFIIDIDQIKPEIDIRWEANLEDGQWYILFIANCSDAPSGINRVEFYVNEELWEIVTGPGPIFEWIEESDIVYQIRGLICRLQITEEDVSFFALIVRTLYKMTLNPESDHVRGYAYDNAGNHEYYDIPGGWHPTPIHYFFKRFTFQGDFEGHLGRFYIDAIFDDEPLNFKM